VRYCGRRAETIDHVIPGAAADRTPGRNCVASCTICNHRKADRLLEELGWTLAVPRWYTRCPLAAGGRTVRRRPPVGRLSARVKRRLKPPSPAPLAPRPPPPEVDVPSAPSWGPKCHRPPQPFCPAGVYLRHDTTFAVRIETLLTLISIDFGADLWITVQVRGMNNGQLCLAAY